MEAKDKIYWEKEGSFLKLAEGKIQFEGRGFDADEKKQWTANATFTLEAFQKGLEVLQKHGAACITDDPERFAETLWMSRNVLSKKIDILAIGKIDLHHGIGFRFSLPLKDLLD